MANTGSSTSRRQSNVSLNVETTLKVSHGLNAQIQTAAMNISVLSLARAGIFAQAVTRNDSCCSRSTFQKTGKPLFADFFHPEKPHFVENG